MRAYPKEAIKDCFELFLKYNGSHFDLIEKEMRAKGWRGWSRQNLITRGKGKEEHLGWIEKYNWEFALKLHLASLPMGALNSAQLLVQEIEHVRKTIFDEIRKLGAKAGGETNRDLIYQHRDYARLWIEALTKVEAARDTLGGFVSFWERLLEILHEVSDKAERELLKVSDQVIERAAKEFGEEQDGTRPPALSKSNAGAAPGIEGSGVAGSKD